MTSQQAHTTIQPDDLFRLKLLQGGQLSPDGKQLVYAVSQIGPDPEKPDEPDANKEFVTLWLMELASGKTRQLTAGTARDSFARWSPDGTEIGFMSTRAGKPQIFIMPVDGGEARQVSFLKQGVGGGPMWSPDGKQIAFSAPPEAEPPDRNKPYRITRHMYRFDQAGYLEGKVHDLWVANVDGGQPRPLTNDGCQNGMPVWSPDGTEILFMSSLFPDEMRMNARLQVVNLDGKVREIIGAWGGVAAATWTPDGKRIIFVGGEADRPIGSKNDVWVVDCNGGAPQNRTASLKPGIGGGLQSDMFSMSDLAGLPCLLLAPDGETVYTHVQDGGIIAIYRIALTGNESFSEVVGGERACYPLSLSGDHLLFGVSTFHNPTDLYSCGLDGSGERQLTHLNSDVLGQRDLPQVEHLEFAGADGVPVEGWIMKPTTGQAPYPTVLYIHGGPHSGFGNVWSFDFQMLAGAGYAVLFVNQRGSTGYGDEFASKIIGDWGNLDYTDLMAGVDTAIARGIADANRLGCCGLSGGGNLSTWIVGQTDRFKAAVPENPVTNWVSFYGVSDIGPWFAVKEMGGKPHEIPEVYHRCSPISYAHRCTTPTLLVQGEADYRCPAEQSEQFYNVLKANGCTVEMLRLPNSSHGGSIRGDLPLRTAQNDALLGWMNKYVRGT